MKPAGSKALGLGVEGQTLQGSLGQQGTGLAQPFVHWPSGTGKTVSHRNGGHTQPSIILNIWDLMVLILLDL